MKTKQATMMQWITSKGRSQQPDITTINQSNPPPNNQLPASDHFNRQTVNRLTPATTTTQTRIATNGQHIELPPSNDSVWGDLMKKKPKDTIRIAFRNINSLPMKLPNSKHDELLNDIITNDFDLLGLVETNVCWKNIPAEDSPTQRFRYALEMCCINYSHNIHHLEKEETRQIGGTMLIATQSLCPRIKGKGNDPTGLGRWTWISFSSKGNLVIIVSIYRPVKSPYAAGVYRQQQRYFLERDNSTCPREQILLDITKQILSWVEVGHTVILLGDFNEPLTSHRMKQFQQETKLHEIIQARHGRHSPNTFAHGTNTIDAIFTTNNIHSHCSGYTPVSWGTRSDHRLLWVDIPSNMLFQSTTSQHLWKPNARRLKLQDPRIVNKYIQLRKQHMIDHNLLDKVRHLQSSLTDGMPIEEAEVVMNQLDHTRVQGIMYADKNCRKLAMGNIPWSPTMGNILHRIRYFRTCLSKLNGSKNVNARTLCKMRKLAKVDVRPTSPDIAEQLLNEAYTEFRTQKHNSVKLRSKFLEDLALAQSLEHNTNHVSVLKQLKDREQCRNMYRKIRYSTNQASKGGVTKLEVLQPDGNWQLTTSKEDIEQACITENITRFTQALNTCSLQESQIQLLGWLGDTTISQEILQGQQLLSDELDPDIKELAAFLSTPPAITNIGEISTSISSEEYRYHWSRCREYTSSGRSGIHFGHFQASCKCNDLTNLDRTFLEISLQYGITLHRWKQATDVMIPKKQDSIRVSKLRTIMLFEADWNFMNKIVGKRTMAHAEKAKTIAPEQYGSRKKKSAIIHASNKQMVFDLLNQRKQNASLLVLDAKSCYDRISIPIASLCLQRQGVPLSVIRAMFQPLSDMKHYIRTSYGDSASYYDATNRRFHGIGQGNGAGPMIWVMVSSPLLDCLRLRQRGIKLTTTTTPIHLTAFTFVDDNDIIQQISDPSDTISEAQTTLTMWDKLLKTTGGCCAPEKSVWSSLVHKFQNDNWSLDPTIHTTTIRLENENFVSLPLERQLATASSKALGINFSPSGSMKDQSDMLLQKVMKWHTNIWHAKLNRYETFSAMTRTIWKTIEYCLTATTMSFKECNKIIGTVLSAGLPKSGICRNMDRRPIFSSTKYQGFGLTHPYYVQGIQKLLLLLGIDNDTSNSLFQLLVDGTIIESGLGAQFLTKQYKVFAKILTKTMVTTLWEFCNRYDIHPINQCSNIEMQYHQDKFIMSILSENVKGKDLQKLNYCRIYLQVEKLSDIITLDGDRIRNDIWKGQPNSVTLDTRIWPHQFKPTLKSWNLWRKSLQQALGTTTAGRLLVPFNLAGFKGIHWKWWYDSTTFRIYENSSTENSPFKVWSVLSTGRRTRSMQFLGSDIHLTDLASVHHRPCTVFHRGNSIQIESVLRSPVSGTVEHTHTNSLMNHIQEELIGSEHYLLLAFIEGHLIMSSDGSHKDDHAAGSWIITSPQLYPEHQLTGSIICPGTASQMDSHRAEAVAIWGAVYTLKKFLARWEMSQGTVEHICDNVSALRFSFDTLEYPFIRCTDPDFDILRSTRSLVLPMVSYRWTHVKGHQDNQYLPLTFHATLNVACDTLANAKRSTIHYSLESYSLPGESWIITLQGVKVCKKFHSTIYNYQSKRAMQQFWEVHRQFSVPIFDTIDWSALELASNRLTRTRLNWMTKHAIGVCGVNTVLKQWKQSETDLCPRCHNEPETSSHVWICKELTTQEVWKTSITSLIKWLQSVHTDPVLIHTLQSNLLHWLNDDFPPHNQRSLLEQTQDSIGWQYVIEGILSIEWANYQNNYYKEIGSHKSGRRWLSQLILKLWNTAWNLWEHRNAMVVKANETQLTLDLNTTVENTLLTVQTTNLTRALISEQELIRLRSATNIYKQKWIKNILTIQSFESRQSLPTRGLQRMQQIMRSFLQN